MSVIDLRSDTVTLPTAAMRAALAKADVGDDVYGEDPSVNHLQELAAKRLGKEAAIFVPSGTMANQAAVRAHTRPGDLVLAGQGAHLLRYEAGAAAAISSVQIETIGQDGFFDADDLRRALPFDDVHVAPLGLVALENTHNSSGGRVFPLERIRAIAAVARENGVPLHMDGARLFNAVVATGIPAATWAEPFDTVSFCLSKGLGAPVGSLVCGSAEVIERVHRVRKMLGGAMRQAGFLAAAGTYALEHHVERLVEDQANATRLAEGLMGLGYDVDAEPETNMVLFRVRDTLAFVQETRKREVLINPVEEGRFRAVTHLDVSESDVDDALGRIAEFTA